MLTFKKIDCFIGLERSRSRRRTTERLHFRVNSTKAACGRTLKKEIIPSENRSLKDGGSTNLKETKTW